MGKKEKLNFKLNQLKKNNKKIINKKTYKRKGEQKRTTTKVPKR